MRTLQTNQAVHKPTKINKPEGENYMYNNLSIKDLENLMVETFEIISKDLDSYFKNENPNKCTQIILPDLLTLTWIRLLSKSK